MSFLKKFQGRITVSYKNRLSFIFSLCLLIPLLFLFVAEYRNFKTYSDKIIEEKLETEESIQMEKFNGTFDALYNKTVYILNSEELLEMINSGDEMNLSQKLEANKIMNTLKMFYSSDSSEVFNLYTTNNTLKNVHNVNISTQSEINFICGRDGIKTVIEKSNGTYYLTVYRKLPSKTGKNQNYTHAISMSVPLSKIFFERNSQKDEYYFFHKYGTEYCGIIAPKTKTVPDFKEFEEKGKIKNFKVKKTVSPKTNGIFYTAVNTEQETRKMNVIKLTFFVVYIFLSVFIIFVMNLLSLKLTNNLTSIISDIELDNIQKPIAKNDNMDEFNIIHNKLYELSTRINDMLKIELQTLSEKVAPHFLYNNLSALKMVYQDKKLEKAVDMLIEYYRNVFQKGTTYVLINSEIKNISNYISLLKFAYDQNFEYTQEINGDTENASILSGLIQPLVENAFIHSINNSDERDAFLSLKIERQESFVEISVSNNHCNEPVENLRNSASKNDNSCALAIIRKRIALYYNENYGINFKKEDDILTTTLKLPYRTIEEM